MKKPGLTIRTLATVAVLVLAAIAVFALYSRFVRHPWTRDGQVSADIIMIAPEITGVVIDVGVVDNQQVAKDDLLFEIDPRDFELAVRDASVQLENARQQVRSFEAAIGAAQAGVTEAEASVISARTGIASAEAQVEAAKESIAAAAAGLASAKAAIARDTAALAQAERDRDRAQSLAKSGAGSVAKAEIRAAAADESAATLDGSRAGLLQAEANHRKASAALSQADAGLANANAGLEEANARVASARAALVKAEADLGEPGDANFRVQAAEVRLANAELDLERTKVRAPADGYVINLNVDPGDYAHPGTAMLAFVDQASFHVQGFFRETQLRHLKPGDRALVTLMSHRHETLEGEVESIGWAINPPGVATTGGSQGLVPQIEPSFDWIRLAQRVPVRIRIESIPEGIQLVSGTTASVVVRP